MHNFNGIQAISVVGIIFSIFCQVALYFIDKKVESMWALYPTWLTVFLIGTFVRYFSKTEEEHHH